MRWLVLIGCACGSAPATKPRVEVTGEQKCAPELVPTIVAVEQELYGYVPPYEKFDVAPRSIGHEIRARKRLDEMFGTNPGGSATYSVECRTNVCRVGVNLHRVPSTWKRLLQESADADIAGFEAEDAGGYLVLVDEADQRWSPGVEDGNCVALEARLARSEARLDALRPLSSSFHRFPFARDREEELAPIVKTWFGRQQLSVTCRGTICRISSSFSNLRAIKASNLFDRVELATGEQARDVVFVQMRDAVARGEEYFATVRTAIKKQGARVRACKPARGGYAFALKLDSDGVVDVAFDRSACLHAIVFDAVAEMPPPGDGAQLPLRPIRFWIH